MPDTLILAELRHAKPPRYPIPAAASSHSGAVLICPPQEADIILGRDEGKNWQGPVIPSLSELLGMV